MFLIACQLATRVAAGAMSKPRASLIGSRQKSRSAARGLGSGDPSQARWLTPASRLDEYLEDTGARRVLKGSRRIGQAVGCRDEWGDIHQSHL
jgi:hypothetical protein